MYFRTKDAKNNFQKEDETDPSFIQATAELEVISKTTLTNLCVIMARRKDWREVIKFADEALLVDDKYSKAYFHKGRALLEVTEYPGAILSLRKAF